MTPLNPSAPAVTILGISGSPRPRGNSRFLLELALQAAAEAGGERMRTELYTIAGKEFKPCTSCYTCGARQGECFLDDDVEELRDKWAAADAVIYSVPVYHLGIPGQLKGAHIFAGQEHTITALVNHALVMGAVPVTGDPWESYIGAAGWTACGERKDSLQKLAEAGDRDAQVAVRASTSLGRRVAQMALISRWGGMAHRAELEADGGYSIFLDRLPPAAGQVSQVPAKASAAQPILDAGGIGG